MSPNVGGHALAVALLFGPGIACSDPRVGTAELGLVDCNVDDLDGKLTICHATGSETDPFVFLHIARPACARAHGDHVGDFASTDPSCGRCDAVECVPPDGCHDAFCDPQTGQCATARFPDGTSCTDGDPCSIAGQCIEGACEVAVSCQMPITSGLVARWDAEGNLEDSAGDNDGVVHGGGGFAGSQTGEAFRFDGVDDFIEVHDSPVFDFGTGDFTVAFWLHPNALREHTVLVHKDTAEASVGGWMFDVTADGVGIRTHDAATSTDARIPVSEVYTEWRLFAGVRQDSTIYLYVDGGLRAMSSEAIPTDVSNGAALGIGASGTAASQFFDGLMDDVRVYDRALSSDELVALTRCLPGYCVPQTSCDDAPTDARCNLELVADHGIAGAPYSLAIGDLDIDGNADVCVGTYQEVPILMGNGDGTLQPVASQPGGPAVYSVAVGDLNGDGKLDLVAGSFGDLTVMLGNGDGSFGTATSHAPEPIPYPSVARSVAIGDLDGDGKPDLAVADEYYGGALILLGRGDGTFQEPARYPTGAQPWSIALGDLDRDGSFDLVLANEQGGNDVSVLLGRGDGTFQAAVNYPAGYQPTSVAIGELDGDGNPDVVVADFNAAYPSDNISVLLGNGDGSLRRAIHFAAGSGPASIALGDLSSDGVLDLAVATTENGGTAAVLLGNANGTFQPAVHYQVGSVTSAAIGDLDNDGRLDLVLGNGGSASISVLLQR